MHYFTKGKLFFTAVSFFMLSGICQAQYVMSTTPVTTCSGTFYDPGYTSNYLPGARITQTFTPGTAGSKLCFIFSSFSLSLIDTLEIFDGATTTAPRIGPYGYNGSWSPGTIQATNPTGQLTFRFTRRSTGAGWAAAIRCLSPTQIVMSNTPITICSGTYYDPGFTLNYLPRTRHTQTFTPATAGSKLCFVFSSCMLTLNDTLEIFDGPTTSAPRIGQYIYNGTNVPKSIQATNPTGQITFRFSSWSTAAGWVAAIRCVSATQFVMSTTPVTTCSGTFYDPGFNTSYPKGQRIVQTFSPATAGSRLSAVFSSFQLTQYDSLEIFDGATVTARSLGRFKGTNSPKSIQASNSAGQLTFRFTSSNGTTAATGWMATIRCVSSAQFVMSNKFDTICSGTFYDPGFTNNYPAGINRMVHSFTPTSFGPKLKFVFSSFRLNTYDSLEIFDGPSTGFPRIGTFKTTNSPGTIVATNSSGALTFRFTSASSSSGWVAAINCVSGGNARIGFTETEGTVSKKTLLFPNPSSGMTRLEFTPDNAAEPVLLELIASDGKVPEILFQGMATPGVNGWDINTAPLQAGLYLVRIRNGEAVYTEMLSVVK